MCTVCEVPGIFHATVLRPPFFYSSKEPRGLVAAQLGARVPGCTRRSGSPTGARFPACCVRVAMRRDHLWAWPDFSAHLSADNLCLAAATSFSPSALPQYLALSSFREKKSHGITKEKINPSPRTRGAITKPS